MTAAPDWADDLARTIIADAGSVAPYQSTHALIAMRLRLLREQGVSDGITRAKEAVSARVAA